MTSNPEPPDYSRDFLKVPRSVLHALIGDELALRLYLLLLDRARYSKHGPKEARRFDLQLGQAVCGRDELAAKLNSTPRRIRTALDLLEYAGILTIEATRLGTVITIVGLTGNGDTADAQRPTSDQRTTNERPTSDQRTTTNEDQRRETEEGRGGEGAPTPAQPSASVQVSSWSQRNGWWQALIAAHRRVRAKGIKPNTPDPTGSAMSYERELTACARWLRSAGCSDAELDAKMLHVIAVAEVEAEVLEHLDFFKPSIIWDVTKPDRFPRKVDTTLSEARKPRGQDTISRPFRSDRPGPRSESFRRIPTVGPERPPMTKLQPIGAECPPPTKPKPEPS